MALNIETQYPGKSNAADANYPLGSARNITTPGDGTGTPLEEAWLNDLFGTQQSLLTSAGITPNGSPDTGAASQHAQAIKAVTATRIRNVATLRTYLPTTDGQLVNLLGHTYDGVGGGGLYYDASDTTTADNNVTVFVTTGGHRWKRQFVRVVQAEWGGLDNTGATDDSALMQAVVDIGLPVTLGVGDFKFANIVPATGKSMLIRGVTSKNGNTRVEGPDGYRGYILNTTSSYDIRGLLLVGGYEDGQYGIGANAGGSSGGRVVLKDVDLRSFDQAIYFGEEYEHPIGLEYSNIYIQTYLTAGVNLGGTSGAASSGESCWSFDNVMAPNTNATPVEYTATVTEDTTEDTIDWTGEGDSPEFGFIVLRSSDGSTNWEVPPNWTSDNYTGESFVADKESGETWSYVVLRMTVGCNLRRGKVINIGVMQNEYSGIGLRLDDVKACTVGSHYYEIRNSTTAQGGFASITTRSSSVVVQTSRAEEAGYNIWVGRNSKVHAQTTVSSLGTIAVFGNGGATDQALTYGQVTLGGTPALYNAPSGGSNDYNYEGTQYTPGSDMTRAISGAVQAGDEYQFRGVKKGAMFADSGGCTVEATRLDLVLNSKTHSPVVSNEVGSTTLTDATATDFLTADTSSINGAGSLRLHYIVRVLDGASVLRQTESGWLDLDTLSVASSTPTATVNVSNDHQAINQGTLTVAFTVTASSGGVTIACNADTSVAGGTPRIEITPISLIGNLENVVQL